MPGPAPKPAIRRQRRNTPAVVARFDLASPAVIPPAPKGVLAVVRERWATYWRSELAKLVDPETDLPAITRLFTLQDERERAYRAFRKQRIVQGSKGQPRLNPLAQHMATLDAEIRQLEDRLGATPRARLQLGVVFGEAARSLADLNRGLENAHDDNNEDPRLKAI